MFQSTVAPSRRLTPQPTARGWADCPSLKGRVTKKDFIGFAVLSSLPFLLKGEVSILKGIFDEKNLFLGGRRPPAPRKFRVAGRKGTKITCVTARQSRDLLAIFETADIISSLRISFLFFQLHALQHVRPALQRIPDLALLPALPQPYSLHSSRTFRAARPAFGQ